MSNKGIGGGVNEGHDVARGMGMGFKRKSNRSESDLKGKSEVYGLKIAAREAQGIPEKEFKEEEVEAENRKQIIENYRKGERKGKVPSAALGQRELLNMDVETFLNFKFKDYLSGEQPSMSTLISNYSKKEPLGMQTFRENLNMPVGEWIEFNKDIPLLEDREKMLKAYLKMEPEKLSERREFLGMSPEDLLGKMGILPKKPQGAEAPHVPDIKPPEYKTPSRTTSGSPYVAA